MHVPPYPMKIAPPDGSGNMMCVNFGICISVYVLMCMYVSICLCACRCMCLRILWSLCIMDTSGPTKNVQIIKVSCFSWSFYMIKGSLGLELLCRRKFSRYVYFAVKSLIRIFADKISRMAY